MKNKKDLIIHHPLKEYLKEHRIKVSDFAEFIGIDKRNVYYYFSKKRFPSRNIAKKISEITGIPILKLLYPEHKND